MFLVYNLLMTVLAPLWVPWMWFRSRRRKEQPNWAERQGEVPVEYRKGAKRIWMHAVSVGEVIAAMPILKELRALLPDHEIVLSVTTSSGHQTAREQAKGLFDHLTYFPLDIPRFQLRAMQRVQPQVVAVMETELWMNFLWAAKTFDAHTMLVNGRISDRSFPRSMRLRFFYRALLAQLDEALMQTDVDRERIVALGARSAEVLGNCKFDQALEGLDADPAAWRSKLGIPEGRPVVVVGSTRGEEEEDFVLEALSGIDATVVHAPRHLERVPDLARKAAGRFGAAALRSKGEAGDYLILDTYGELSSVYAVADVVVIGGGFANHGGQNLLQPLAHGKPVLHGPHMQNFRSVADAAVAAGASRVCTSPAELREALTELLDSPAERDRMGSAAQDLIERNRGASRRYAERIAAAVKGR